MTDQTIQERLGELEASVQNLSDVVATDSSTDADPCANERSALDVAIVVRDDAQGFVDFVEQKLMDCEQRAADGPTPP